MFQFLIRYQWGDLDSISCIPYQLFFHIDGALKEDLKCEESWRRCYFSRSWAVRRLFRALLTMVCLIPILLQLKPFTVRTLDIFQLRQFCEALGVLLPTFVSELERRVTSHRR